jgi:hypothetical protein
MPSVSDLYQDFRGVMNEIERGRERSMRGEGGLALDDPRHGGLAIDPAAATLRAGDTVHVRVPARFRVEEGWMDRISREYMEGIAGVGPVGAIDWAAPAVYSEAERAARRQPPAAPKDPARVEVTATPVDDEYRALAQRLGLDPTPIDVERFKAWINERGLCVYDRGDVQRYLDHKYGVPPGAMTDYVRWGWRPLREGDRKPRGLGPATTRRRATTGGCSRRWKPT